MASEIKWCCPGFKNSTERPDERGHRVVSYSSDPTRFFLNYRSIDQQHIGKLKTGFPISIIGRVVLLFCPWCGANLAKRYGKQSALPREAKDPMQP
jgi:hypothetical protein